jgi:chromosome segregation ATPase
MFIQVREEKWCLAVEKMLGGLLHAFVCGDYKDEAVLHDLLEKHQAKYTRVIVQNLSEPLYDVSRFVTPFLI